VVLGDLRGRDARPGERRAAPTFVHEGLLRLAGSREAA